MLHLRIAGAQLAQFGQFRVRGLSLEISVDQPLVRLGLVRLVGDNDRGRRTVREQILGIGDGLALRPTARDGDAVAYLPCSLASRWSSATVARSA